MVLERRRHEKQPWRDVRERDAGEISTRRKLLAIEVPLDPHPVIERLKGQMNVLDSLHLDHGEPSVAVDAQQVDDASLTGGELRDLSIKRLRVNHGVERFDLRPYLRFEPRFGMAQVDRIGAVERL